MFRNKFNPTILAVVLIALLCFFLPDMQAQVYQTTTKDTTLKLFGDYRIYDRGEWNTVRFPKSTDTLRIIIDKDTLFTDENYFRVLVRYELKKMLGKK